MTTTTKRDANGAFIGHCLRIDAALEQLAKLRADHFGVDPEAQRRWDEVGTVEKIANDLEELIAFATPTEGGTCGYATNARGQRVRVFIPNKE